MGILTIEQWRSRELPAWPVDTELVRYCYQQYLQKRIKDLNLKRRW